MADENNNNEAVIATTTHCDICKRNGGDWAGLHLSCIETKHLRLRGSAALLYTRGTVKPTCPQQCGCGKQHDCYLRTGHGVDGIGHKFTSECRDGN